jgi:L-asparaginase II
MTHTSYAPVVEVTRGPIVESLHFGAIAVCDPFGNLLASYGDPSTVTYLRSSAKPFQALPFIEAGGDLHFGLTQVEVALLCASHSGTDAHVAVAKSIQAKIGVKETDLLCGTHAPMHAATARALEQRGEAPTPNRHNCSGKHSGMLAHARLRGWAIENYVDPEHPLQQLILKSFAEMAALPVDQVVVGIDGCSAPNFAIPLVNAARAYANLIDPRGLAPERAAACARITSAMTGNPFMVGGPERFDTRLMELASGRLLVKSGAEGYQGIALPAEALGPGTPALGIAFKIADGDSSGRARPCAALEILRQLGAISASELNRLEDYAAPILYNQKHLAVGQVRPHFELVKDERYFGA